MLFRLYWHLYPSFALPFCIYILLLHIIFLPFVTNRKRSWIFQGVVSNLELWRTADGRHCGAPCAH
ncbi:hypothetical protein BDW02DRAFT_258361 [Decorospora gaudefroyi]|uniref:Uncharacterized protein n=1 Tax=Decorospora gaudefroyi TaxID=184978 RepID=A0A6A5KIR1_9PLEO|nr:hypothetical protein BDW02DRAFT_258361 [Decorospora gaudefroyi]